jgi:methylated-DNA-[protein]-cysteine S-methyltransferase
MPATIAFPSPLGIITLQSDAEFITGCDIGRASWQPDSLGSCREATTPPPPFLRDAAKQILDFLDGDRVSFDLNVEVTGTAFQHAVWRILATIPFGTTMTYGEIASAVGVPRAGRAVGAAVAANPVPLLVPCHRVLGIRRNPVGYDRGQGLDTKLWLLRHESIAFQLTTPRSPSLETVR